MDVKVRCTLIIDASDEEETNIVRASRTLNGPDAIALAIAGALEGTGWCRQIETLATAVAFLEEWAATDPVNQAREVFGADIASALFRFLRAAREVRDLVEKRDEERGLRPSAAPDDEDETTEA